MDFQRFMQQDIVCLTWIGEKQGKPKENAAETGLKGIEWNTKLIRESTGEVMERWFGEDWW